MMGELSNRINGMMSSFEKSEQPPFPKKNLLLEVSNYCNHKCMFCANKKMTRKRGFMSLEFAENILCQAYDLGMREVGLYATGEPLTNPNIDRYIKLAKKIGYSYIYLTTNGALLTPRKLQRIIDAGLDSIKFSVNAGNPKTYELIHGRNDFAHVVDIIRYAYEYRKEYSKNFKIFVSCIVTKYSIDEKEKLVSELKNVVDEIYFSNVLNQGGLMYEINEGLILDDDKERPNLGWLPCPSLFNAVTISYEGYLTACCVDFQNYLVVADLNIMNLFDAWNSNSFRRLRKMHLENNIKGILCYNCVYNKKIKIAPFDAKYATIIDVY